MKRVEILMSTYCGEKYLREQLDSILAQDCEEYGVAEFHVLVRDDGSKDATQEILEEYTASYPDKIRWYQGENKGVIKSFFELLEKADDHADFYAFADQDDYWMPDKIRAGIRAIEGMKEDGRPRLYSCRPKLVDKELKELDSQIKRPRMRPAFENALVENIVTGCTIVMDAVLRAMVIKEYPKYTKMHDWWFYLVASCFGTVYYDEIPHICYRQHGGNTVGTNVSRFRELQDRIRRFKGNRQNISRQLGEFLRIFGDLESREDLRQFQGDKEAEERIAFVRELLESKKSFPKRASLVRSGKIYRQRKNDDRIFRLILLSGSF